jgi:hypothetical protein
MKVIDKIFSEHGAAASLQHLKPAAKAKSYGICSQIAEEEGDFGFALKCAVSACWEEPGCVASWVRALKSAVKYALAVTGIRN